MNKEKFNYRKKFPTDWLQTLTIVATVLGAMAWLDSKHERAIEKMDERWKWLFDWAHKEISDLKCDKMSK